MSIPHLPRESVGLPKGVRLRPFRDGDRELWFELQASTGIYGSISPELFDREFGTSGHAQRIIFAEVGELPVGVAAAWHPEPTMPAHAGRVHWVAVRPSHQRRGIGRALVQATLERFRELGYASAYLTTGSENRIAIELYRGLGFVTR